MFKMIEVFYIILFIIFSPLILFGYIFNEILDYNYIPKRLIKLKHYINTSKYNDYDNIEGQ